MYAEISLDHKLLRESVEKKFPRLIERNAFIERFNRTCREDVLDANLFETLEEARLLTRTWMKLYNEERPHESLANQSPQKFALLRAS